MFFKDWQIESLNVLWSSERGLLSLDVWTRVKQRGVVISRASVINFLNHLLELGILEGSDETGKGGQRARYSIRMSEHELKQHLSGAVERKLKEMIGSS